MLAKILSLFPRLIRSGVWAGLLFTLLISAFAASAPAPSNPTFKRGLSVGHWLAKARGGQYGGTWFGKDDVVWIAQQGFDHVRFPVDGRLWLLADGSLDEPKVARFIEAAGWARESGLNVVLDLHFLPGGDAPYDANNQDSAIFTDARARATAASFWGVVSRRFVREGSWLRFELINEPMAPQNAQLNTLNQALLAAIRAVDSQRVVYLTSNLSSSFLTLEEMTVPADPRVALLLHYDEPMIFTHQRASWKQLPATMPPVNFPGTVPDLTKLVSADHFAAKVSGAELTVEDIDLAFAKAAAWIAKNASGHEVYLGGFGSYERAPAESRRVFTATVCAAAERHGWGWCVWDYKSSFGVRTADGKSTAVLDGLQLPKNPSASN